ncbi:MAG: hypothetical protein OXI87_22285 [Albidovulum sp.]|nr:hypothetical protein [Albidovulum sp.]
MPLILPECAFGACVAKLPLFDIWIMFATSVIGWLLWVFNFSVGIAAPGAILAPLADENYR